MARALACLVVLLQIGCGPIGVGLGLDALFGSDAVPPTTLPAVTPRGGPTTTSDPLPCLFYEATNRRIAELTIEVRIDGALITNPAGNPLGSIEPNYDDNGWAICLLRALSEGPHLIEVNVTDNHGNEFDDEITLTVDTESPAPIELTEPVVQGNGRFRDLVVRWKAPGDDTVSVKVFLFIGDALATRVSDALSAEQDPEVRDRLQLLHDELPGQLVRDVDHELAAQIVTAAEVKGENVLIADIARNADQSASFAGLDRKDAEGGALAYHAYAVATDLAGNVSAVSNIRGMLLDDATNFSGMASEQHGVNVTNDPQFPASEALQWSAAGEALYGVVPDPETGENSFFLLEPRVDADGNVTFDVAEFFTPPDGAPAIDKVVAIDANGDGLLDFYGLSTATRDAPSVLSAYRKVRDGGFTLAADFYTFDADLAPDEIEPIDITLDGYLDLIVRTRNIEPEQSGALVVIVGHGAAAGFTPIEPKRDVRRFELDLAPVAGRSGHFDSDTYADYTVLDGIVARTLFGTGTTASDPLPGLPAAGFDKSRLSVPNGGPMRLDRADFNRDGIADFVTSNADGTISILLSRASRLFDLPVDVPVGTRFGPLAVGDFNDDKVPDIAVAGAADGELTILISRSKAGQWDGTFHEPVARTLGFAPGVTPIGLSVADFNDDGRVDFLVAPDTGSPQLLLGAKLSEDPPGSFTTSPRLLPSFHAVRSLLLIDGNGDGLQDVMAGGRHADLAVATLYPAGGQNGVASGTFRSPQSLGGLGDAVQSMASADFDRDGISDVALAGPDGFAVQFGTPLRFVPDADHTVPSGDVELGRRTISGDFNHDGIPDLASLVGDSVLLHIGANANGVANGTFGFEDETLDFVLDCSITDYKPLFDRFDTGLRYALRADSGAEDLAAADFDGDGGVDLIVSDTSTTPGVSILRNFGRPCADDTPASIPDRPGYGQFMAPKLHRLQFKPGRIVVGDLNGDRIPDVVALAKAPTQDEETFCVLLGKRGTPFTFEAVPYHVGTKLVDAALIDLDRDGDLDVVVLDAQDGVYVLHNTGTDGALGTATLRALNLPPSALPFMRLAAGRLDFDIALDLAIGCQDGVRILFGDS